VLFSIMYFFYFFGDLEFAFVTTQTNLIYG
jgi:hypothetical protein